MKINTCRRDYHVVGEMQVVTAYIPSIRLTSRDKLQQPINELSGLHNIASLKLDFLTF